MSDQGGQVPFNLLDWQAQQKALKERERKNKTSSARMLHSYRGSVEAPQLSTIKTVERQKQLDARATLRTYRASMDDVKASMTKPLSTPKPRQREGPPVEIIQSPAVEEVTSGVSVAAKAATFGQPKRPSIVANETQGEPETADAKATVTVSYTPSTVFEGKKHGNATAPPNRAPPPLEATQTPTPNETPAAPSETTIIPPEMLLAPSNQAYFAPLAPSTNPPEEREQPANPQVEPEEHEPLSEYMVIDEEPVLGGPEPTDPRAPATTAASDEWVSVQPINAYPTSTPSLEVQPSDANPTSTVLHEVQPINPFTASTPSQDVQPVDDIFPANTPSQEEEPQPIVADDEWGNKTVRTSNLSHEIDDPTRNDVEFSFALITQEVVPMLERYTKAIDRIVVTEGVILSHRCTVSRYEQDYSFADPNGRAGIKRFLVYATLQVASEPESFEESKGIVLNGLRAACLNGSLFKKAVHNL